MNIQVQLTEVPIPESIRPVVSGSAGAWVEFRGLVRGLEDERQIAALEYEAYQPMAESQMRRILEELALQHPCLEAVVIHRVGVVPVGEAAIFVGFSGKHRIEAFAMLTGFMDRLKKDVPIWKVCALPKINGHCGAHSPEPTPAHISGGARASNPAGVHSAAEVMQLLREQCHALEPERVALDHALGRVLREPVAAPEAQPAFDRSSMDGFAVRSDDPGPRFTVISEVRAGDWKPCALNLGEAVRISTGGAVPSDGLQVIMKEDTRIEDGTLTVLRRDAERNIRFRGEDAAEGQELVAVRTTLQPGTLGLLASLGCTKPLVTRLPRVLHLATGNEIIDPDHTPGRGQVRDANSTLVKSFLQEWGITPEQHRVGEDQEAVRNVLNNCKRDIDLLLISGGASVGEHDFTRKLLEDAGFEILVSRTTARPGKPLIVARRGQTIAFGLPGNPLAHFVGLNLYVRSSLEAWSGATKRSMFRKGVLVEDLENGGSGRETFWPARCQLGAETPELTPLPWRSSGDLTSLSTANALLRVESQSGKLRPGSRVEFILTGRSFA